MIDQTELLMASDYIKELKEIIETSVNRSVMAFEISGEEKPVTTLFLDIRGIVTRHSWQESFPNTNLLEILENGSLIIRLNPPCSFMFRGKFFVLKRYSIAEIDETSWLNK
jgi:hypothetical protein